MTSSAPYPWDRLPAEPGRWYARFLIYRNLGPARSLAAAVRAGRKGRKKADAPGSWRKAARRWDWADRAARWDIAHLREAGALVVARWLALIERSIDAAHVSLDTIRPQNIAEFVALIDALGRVIPASTLAAVCLASGREDYP